MGGFITEAPQLRKTFLGLGGVALQFRPYGFDFDQLALLHRYRAFLLVALPSKPLQLALIDGESFIGFCGLRV